MKYPCYGCQERSPGCHGRCSKYIEAVEEHQKQEKEFRKHHRKETDFYEFKTKAISIVKKRYKLK